MGQMRLVVALGLHNLENRLINNEEWKIDMRQYEFTVA